MKKISILVVVMYVLNIFIGVFYIESRYAAAIPFIKLIKFIEWGAFQVIITVFMLLMIYMLYLMFEVWRKKDDWGYGRAFVGIIIADALPFFFV